MESFPIWSEWLQIVPLSLGRNLKIVSQLKSLERKLAYFIVYGKEKKSLMRNWILLGIIYGKGIPTHSFRVMWKTPDWKIKWKVCPGTVKSQDPDINKYIVALLRHIINSGRIRPLQIK